LLFGEFLHVHPVPLLANKPFEPLGFTVAPQLTHIISELIASECLPLGEFLQVHPVPLFAKKPLEPLGFIVAPQYLHIDIRPS
jgi:hypothetical protein